MSWIFQGNPEKFKIAQYLKAYQELIYWRTPRHADQISVGDRAYIWRSRVDAGAIAVGTVVEAPTPVESLKVPSALGEEFWLSDIPEYTYPRTGIRIDEIRLTPDDGMVTREDAKASDLMSESSIVRMPRGTVFQLSADENEELERLWGVDPAT